MISNWAFIVGLSVFVALFVTIACVQAIVKRRLRKRYADNPNVPDIAYDSLDHSAKRTILFFKFIAQKRYSNLGDTKLTRDCNVLRVLYVFYLVVFVWVCVSIVLLPPR